MAYHVEFADPVRAYLANAPGLSDDDRNAVIDGVTEELGRGADYFLLNRPLAHESLSFRYDYPHITYQTLYTFDFIVDATHIDMGVVRVTYVECTTEPAQ